MSNATSDVLHRQFETAWKLAQYHLNGLTTQECLWRPTATGLHVRQDAGGTWRADWPDREGYDIGPPSIGWLTWHIGFWWSTAIDHAFGDGTLKREDLTWPGSGDDARAWIEGLQAEWAGALARLSDDDFASPARARWPFRDRPFADVVAWVNVELTKNAAEIGYARFLCASRKGGSGEVGSLRATRR